MRTVQGDLEDALGRVVGTEVATIGAGRTDAGVHALGQVISVHVDDDVETSALRRALNHMLAPSIAVASCSPVADDFHARFNARSRTYVYAILDGDTPDPFLARTTAYHASPLSVDAMNEAAGHLLGPHDFSSFGRLPDRDAPAERNLYELHCRRAGRVVRITARANAFIQQMVRSIVGTLIQVGEGRTRPDELPQMLDAKDRAAAGPVAAPHGLCLVSVEYDEGWSRPFDPFR